MKQIKVLAAIARAAPVPAFTHANAPRVDQRQANQQQRIR
jgi:hypothetical protein